MSFVQCPITPGLAVFPISIVPTWLSHSRQGHPAAIVCIEMSAADSMSTGPSRMRADLLCIYAAAVSAVEPRRLIARALSGAIDGGEDVSSMVDTASGIYLLAVGKAAAGMAAEAQSRVETKLKEGLIIVPGGSATAASDHGGSTTVVDFGRVLPASHPIPDASSEAAGRAALEMASHAKAEDLLLMLLS